MGVGTDNGRVTAPPIKLEMRLVAELVPFARNSRTHSDAQVAQIAASIREFGFTNPILTDGENGIIAGHGRLQAARKLGLAEVPTIPLAGLTDAQKATACSVTDPDTNNYWLFIPATVATSARIWVFSDSPESGDPARPEIKCDSETCDDVRLSKQFPGWR